MSIYYTFHNNLAIITRYTHTHLYTAMIRNMEEVQNHLQNSLAHSTRVHMNLLSGSTLTLYNAHKKYYTILTVTIMLFLKVSPL